MERVLELPHDVEALRSLAQAQLALLDEHRQTIAQLREANAQLEERNRVLAKWVFGCSSEKRVPQPGDPSLQGNLFLADIAAEAERLAAEHQVVATVEVPRHTRTKGKRRGEFPAHLPVVRTVCELRDEDRVCACGGELKEFGEETSRELERIEMTVVHETARKKYACSTCHEGVVTAPWRGKVIDKGLLGPGFLSHVITERFARHQPYYRLEGKYRAEGLELSRSVLCESVARCAELLEPIAEQLRKEVLASPVVHTDDTPVTLAMPQASQGGSRQGRVWVYLNPEGRHWYEFTESRKRDGPARVFADFNGYLQADAYGGYDQLFFPGGATEVACWSHVRRKFVDAEATDPVLAKEAIDRIRALFQIEEAAKELSDAARAELRRAKARPLLTEFEAWLKLAETQALPKSPLGKAIVYAQNQWPALVRYVDDGRLSISNNAAERALRPFAVGRKNWLFFQREGGGKTAATLMSLLMTAQAAGIHVGDYFRDVLVRISTCTDVTKLTPQGWKDHYAAEVTERRHALLREIAGER
jgi:transposase